MPDYNKYKANLEKARELTGNYKGSLTVLDFTPSSSSLTEALNEKSKSILDVDAKLYGKYDRYGINFNWDRYASGQLDRELANNQSNWEKLGNALGQALYSEMVLGTIKGFADVYDIVTGAVFRGDNDYTNAASRYLESLQEEYKANNPIYSDPTRNTIADGGLGNFGWWMSNLPSVASTVALMIPGRAVSAVPGLIAKGARAAKATSYTKKGLNMADRIRTAQEVESMSRVGRWLATPDNRILLARRVENGLNALAMRTIENYQEGRQVYNDTYTTASEYLNGLSQEEYAEWLANHQNDIQGINVEDRDQVARKIATKAADRTFISDYANLIFDVVQVHAIRNPLKYSKNMRATAGVNKAQRESILATANAVRASDKQIKNSIGQNIKGFLSDRAKAAGTIASELTESIEEAINYIAQEEGIHYGNTLLTGEGADSNFGYRLNSYLRSSDLYDAAFWGALGGIGFQKVGSGINRVTNFTAGKIHDARSRDKKTSEQKGTDGLDRFETSENKYRGNKISKRVAHFNLLKDKLAAIENGKNPNNPEQDLNPAEKEVQRNAAIKEYLTNLTFDAIDSGTWDLTKDYLRDENVQEALRQAGIITPDSGNVESLISQMEEIEKQYNDNLIALNSMSARINNVPFEFINIIARDNVAAQQRLEDLNEAITAYETSASANELRFGANLDNTVDYKAAIDLQVTANRLGQLKAVRRNILKDKNRAKSIDGQNQLAQIDRELKLVNEHLNNILETRFINSLQGKVIQDGTVHDRWARAFWANALASQIEYDENTGRLSINQNTDEYADFLSTIATKDTKIINDFAKNVLGMSVSDKDGKSLELTDNDIIRIFGEGSSNAGTYSALMADMNSVFDAATGLKTKAAELNDDYVAIAGLSLERLNQQSKLINTDESLLSKINQMSNYMDKARAKAVSKAQEVLYDLGKKYGYNTIAQYVFDNVDNFTTNENYNEADRTRLVDALEVLNFANPNNADLARIIRQNLLNAELEKAFEEVQKEAAEAKGEETEDTAASENEVEETGEEDREKSSASENQNREQENQSPTTNSQQPQNPPQSSKTEQSEDETPSQTQMTEQNSKYVPISDIDTGVTFKQVFNTEDVFGFSYKELASGQIMLDAKATSSKTDIPKSVLANTALFSGYDANNPFTPRIASNPIIMQDDNGRWVIVNKGTLSYERETPQQSQTKAKEETPAPTSFTGETTSGDYIPKDTRDINAENEVRDNVKKEILSGITEVGKDKITEEKLNEIVANVREQYKSQTAMSDREYQTLVNSMRRIFLNQLKKQGFLKSSSDVLSSTIVETYGQQVAPEFLSTIDRMIEDYAKEFGIEPIDGKYYINLEDLLRRINETYADDGYVANLLYTTIEGYLHSNRAKEKYVIKDISNRNVVSDSVKSIEQRLAEQFDSSLHRVNIDEYFEDPTDKFLNVFDSIRVGDKLEYEVSDNRIVLKKNGTVIGSMTIPVFGENTGKFTQINKGWITEVWKENGIIHSNLAPIFTSILEQETKEAKDIYKLITKLGYDSIEGRERTKLLNNLYKQVGSYIKNVLKITTPVISLERHKKTDVANHLVNLFKYINVSDTREEFKTARIQLYVNNWFEKLYNDYERLNVLEQAVKNGNVDVEVNKITSGEFIRNVVASNASADSYDDFTQTNKAFAEPDKVVLAIRDFKGELFLVSTKPVSVPKSRMLTMKASVPNFIVPKKNTDASTTGYKESDIDVVSGTSARLTDNNLKGDAKKAFDTIRKEFTTLFSNFVENSTEENYNKLKDFCYNLFYNNGVGFVYGVNFYDLKKQGFSLAIGERGKAGYKAVKISLPKTYGDLSGEEFSSIFSIKLNTEQEFRGVHSYGEDYNNVVGLLKEILSNARFNVSETHIKGDNNNNTPSGFITRNAATREVTITIPDSKTGKPFTKTYSSFNELVIKGGFVKVNTHVEKGSNYRRKGVNQAANQVLEVKINVSESTPVKESDAESTSDVTTSENKITAAQFIENNKVNVEGIVNNVFADLTEDEKNELKSADIFPKNVILDEELNRNKDKQNRWIGDNARARVNTGETFVGHKWVDMFNETGEFANGAKGSNRMQAIRKLIHEQLHHKLHANQDERTILLDRIEEVYNEFKASLDANNIPADSSLRQYLFDNDNYNRERRLEEFLVECLTSEPLVNYLNSVESNVEKTNNTKETLWERIFNVISKLFGWDVKENTLRDKTLQILRRELSESSSSNITPEVKQEPRVRRKGPRMLNADKDIRSSTVTENTQRLTLAEKRLFLEQNKPDYDSIMREIGKNLKATIQRQGNQIKGVAVKEPITIYKGRWYVSKGSSKSFENGRPIITQNSIIVKNWVDTALKRIYPNFVFSFEQVENEQGVKVWTIGFDNYSVVKNEILKETKTQSEVDKLFGNERELSVGVLLTKLINQNNNSKYNTLLSLLQENIGSLADVSVIKESNETMMSFGNRTDTNVKLPWGIYSPTSNTIHINENIPTSQRVATTFVHELLHAIANNHIKNEELLTRINNIFNDVVAAFEKQTGKTREELIGDTSNIYYGLNNVDEFISEIFANPFFAKEINKLKGGKERQLSLFDEFINWLFDLFGSAPSNLYIEAAETVKELLTTYDGVTRERGSLQDAIYDRLYPSMFDLANQVEDTATFLREVNDGEYNLSCK